MLLESFDKNLYVDVYELRQKIYEQMYTFFLSNKVNTETAGYKSQNFQAFLYLARSGLNCSGNDNEKPSSIAQSSRLNCTLTIKLPIHVRYHTPKIPLGDSCDACNESSLSLEEVSSSEENRTELDVSNSDESAAVSGETNGYFRFSIRKPRLFFSADCMLINTSPKPTTKSASNRKPTSTTAQVTQPQLPLELDLPCRKNKSIRNDYLFLVGDPQLNTSNSNNMSAEAIAKKYSSVCKWFEYKFDQVRVEKFFF